MGYPVEVDLTRIQRAKVRIEVPSALVPGEEHIGSFPDEETRILDLLASVYSDSEIFDMAERTSGIDGETVKVIAIHGVPYGGRCDFCIDVPAMREWEV